MSEPVDHDASPAHAAIDIGTNSIHLLVGRATGPARFETLAQEKEVVRLGAGAGDMRLLTDDAMDRGIAALRRFRQVADIWQADISAVATSAVREADNHDTFIDRARHEAGIDVEVIAGVEEARLIHVGVLHALPIYEQQHLVVDIGGGSTELVIGRRDDVIDIRSLKLGAIRLTDRFFAEESIDGAQVEACRTHVRATVEPTAREFVQHGFEVAVGSSGTVETLTAMAVARRGGDPKSPLNNLSFTMEELAAVVDDLTAATTSKERARLPGMDAKRADIIVAGAIILEQVLTAMGATQVRFSSFALREGVLLDRMRQGAASLHHLTDLRRTSVVHLAEQLDPHVEHSVHLTGLALKLYDDLAAVHGLADEWRELLEAAGLLHNVGLFISHSAHHKHSYYVIRNSDHLLGFTDHEIELIAQVARYHRKSPPKDKHPEHALLSAEERRAVTVLAGILRVAIGLDRSHALAVEAVAACVDPHAALITVEARPHDGADLSLELYSAAERTDLLAESLGVSVVVRSTAG